MPKTLEKALQSAIFVLISGKKYAGKDIVGSIVKGMLDEHNDHYTNTIIPFALELKRQYGEIHGLDLQMLLENAAFKEIHREGLINLGAEKREVDEDYWCKLVLNAFSEWVPKSEAVIEDNVVPVLIITDARFVNEIEFFRAYVNDDSTRLITIRVEATVETRVSRGFDPNGKTANDKSETSLDAYPNFTIIQQNDFTSIVPLIEQLKPRLEELFSVKTL